MTTEDLLNEREHTHGDFNINAEVMVRLYEAIGFGLAESGARASYVQRAAFTHICGKLARATCNPHEREHWKDIQGYAGLVLRTLEKTKEEKLSHEIDMKLYEAAKELADEG